MKEYVTTDFVDSLVKLTLILVNSNAVGIVVGPLGSGKTIGLKLAMDILQERDQIRHKTIPISHPVTSVHLMQVILRSLDSSEAISANSVFLFESMKEKIGASSLDIVILDYADVIPHDNLQVVHECCSILKSNDALRKIAFIMAGTNSQKPPTPAERIPMPFFQRSELFSLPKKLGGFLLSSDDRFLELSENIQNNDPKSLILSEQIITWSGGLVSMINCYVEFMKEGSPLEKQFNISELISKFDELSKYNQNFKNGEYQPEFKLS